MMTSLIGVPSGAEGEEPSVAGAVMSHGTWAKWRMGMKQGGGRVKEETISHGQGKEDSMSQSCCLAERDPDIPPTTKVGQSRL